MTAPPGQGTAASPAGVSWDELTAGADTIERGRIRIGNGPPPPRAAQSSRTIALPGGPPPAGNPFAAAQAAPGTARCTATARSTGQQCKRNADPGKNKCSRHDGSGSQPGRSQQDRGIAPHPVDVSQAGWTYCCADCASCRESGLDRGIYLDARHLGPLPYVRARISTHEGAGAEVHYLMGAEPDGPAEVIACQDVDSGRWADRLGVRRSADRRVIDAAATAIRDLADYSPLRNAALRPEDRTGSGHVPEPEEGCLPEGYLAQPRMLPEAARRRARLILASIARRRPKIALTYGASLSAPFAGPLGEQSHWWDLFGRPRQGKTITLMVAASAWGSPRTPPGGDLIRSWDATARWLARRLGKLGLFPAFVDESGTASFTAADWARVVYGSVQGASRGQAETYGVGERHTPGWSGVLFTTGNGRVTAGLGAGATAGILARVIELEGPFTAAPAGLLQSEPERLIRAVLADYGWAGPEVLRAVTVEDMRAMMRSALDALGAPASGTAGTIARHLALAVAGAMAADRVFGTPGAFTAAAMAAARDYLAVHSAEPESDRERLLAELASSMAARRGAWPHVNGLHAQGLDRELLGAHDGDFVYVLGRAWRELVTAAGVDEAVALAELYEAGELYVTEQRRRSGHWTMEGPREMGKPRCHKIRRSALAGPDDEPPAGDGAGGWPAGSVGAEMNAAPELAPWITPGQRACPVHQARRGYHSGCPDCRALNTGTEPAELAEADPGNGSRTAAPADRARREAFTAAAMARHGGCKHAAWSRDQQDVLAGRLELLDDPAIGDAPERLRLLEPLEGSHGKDGPFAPARQVTGRGGKPYPRGPYWQPPLPLDVIETAWITACPAFSRDYGGPVIELDRNTAYPSASASADIALGQLEQTGEIDLSPPGPVRPGYYLMDVYPWAEPGLPSPLGGARPGSQQWLPAPTAALLADLARQGRWPDATAADSWTGEPAVRLASWAHLLAELRRYALEAHGRDSGAYDAVKVAAGQARGLMKGRLTGGPLDPRKWECKARRPDIPQHIEAQNTVTMWRAADKALRAAPPGLGPVAIKDTDTLIIPAAAWEAVTGGDQPVIRIDAAELALGSFKIKGPRP
jgi:hypothetical protein